MTAANLALIVPFAVFGGTAPVVAASRSLTPAGRRLLASIFRFSEFFPPSPASFCAIGATLP
jgi:hypothetical protein